MARYLKVTHVKQLAHELGRRVGRGYIAHLDARVERIVRADAAAQRGRITLTALDAAALEQLAKIRRIK